jgi:hypothetical protein
VPGFLFSIRFPVLAEASRALVSDTLPMPIRHRVDSPISGPIVAMLHGNRGQVGSLFARFS